MFLESQVFQCYNNCIRPIEINGILFLKSVVYLVKLIVGNFQKKTHLTVIMTLVSNSNPQNC